MKTPKDPMAIELDRFLNRLVKKSRIYQNAVIKINDISIEISNEQEKLTT